MHLEKLLFLVVCFFYVFRTKLRLRFWNTTRWSPNSSFPNPLGIEIADCGNNSNISLKFF